MEKVASIEKAHEERYRKLAANIKDGKVFARDTDVLWHCSNCAYEYTGKKALDGCPVCHHPKAFFEIKAENY